MYTTWARIQSSLRNEVERAGRAGFRELAAPDERLRLFDSAPALLLHLHGRAGSDAERDGILAYLFVASRGDGKPAKLARALVWLALWPSLDATLHTTAEWACEDPDELTAELAEKFTIVVARLDLAAVTKVAATLAWNTRRRLWHSLAARREVRQMELPSGRDADLVPQSDHTIEVVETIADVERLAGRDADLVLACLLGGLTAREAGVQWGAQREAIKKRVQRAVSRVRCDEDDDPIFVVPDHPGALPIPSIGVSRKEVPDGKA